MTVIVDGDGPKEHTNTDTMLIQVLGSSLVLLQKSCYTWALRTNLVLSAQLHKGKAFNHHVICALQIGQDHPYLWKQT